MRHPRLCVQVFIVVAAAALTLGLLGLAGCSTEQDAALQQEVANVRVGLDEAAARLEATRAALAQQLASAQLSGNASAIASAEKSIKAADEIKARLDQSRAVVSAAVNPDGTVNWEGSLTTLGGMAPFPFNLIIALGGTTIVAEIRRRRAIAAAKSIVNGLDALRIENPAVAEAMKASASRADGFDSAYTPLAEKIVAAERIS